MTIMQAAPDEVVIEGLLSFQTMTTVEQDERSMRIQFLFILGNIQEIQIVGSLFEKGQHLSITSALLTREGLDPGLLTITAIRSVNGSLYWDCMSSSSSVLSPVI